MQHFPAAPIFGNSRETFLLYAGGMTRFVLLAWVLLATVVSPGRPAAARPQPAASIPAPSALCRAAILQAERTGHLPDRLLDAIAVVESGKRDPVSGAVYAWPWTINAEGVGHWYDSKADAVAAVQALQARGVRSIDVGCMQVNLMHHPDAFTSLEAAFDPMTNAAYAARFLQQLFNQTNAWPLAAAAYHSFTPDLGAEYARKVLAAWGVPQLPVGAQAVTNGPASGPPAAAAAFAAQAPISPFGAAIPGRVAVMLPAGGGAIRSMPVAAASPAGPAPSMAARGLDAYRAMPITYVGRSPRLF